MNPPAATFADFPVELCEHVILLAARACALDDKPTLAALARASRSIHALVQPILVETVFVTSSNIHALLAHAAPARVFATTRALIVENMGDEDSRKFCTPLEQGDLVFPNIALFYGPAEVFYALLHFSSPRRVVLVPGPRKGFYPLSDRQLCSATRLTHIHGGEDMLFFLALAIGHLRDSALSLRDSGMCLTHIVLAGLNLDDALLAVPVLTLLPKLHHMCILSWDETRRVQLQSIVNRQKDEGKDEARLGLWVDDSNVPPYDRCMVLNDEYWSIGTPFSAPHAV
ncbi:hypothetical protein EXIGLDRAFT_721108 [Exidia glandulosa HHB12029]|uniref:F-box domain-containing protein n=1 Tax=Exidia glandulosa HHB12029 TaxID=1314781 RepID=A0A166A917_EXIGL|nr:hypothetical protein EXIGLDRAFT_721108 [Exidia glandulosa HHB12029]